MSDWPGASYTWRDTTADQFSSADHILSPLDSISTAAVVLDDGTGWLVNLTLKPAANSAHALFLLIPAHQFPRIFPSRWHQRWCWHYHWHWYWYWHWYWHQNLTMNPFQANSLSCVKEISGDPKISVQSNVTFHGNFWKQLRSWGPLIP